MSSVAFDKVVPFWEDFVFDDIPLALTLKERVAFFLCLIYVPVDRREYGESRLCRRFGSHITGLLDRVEDGSAPFSGYLGEEPVLDGVPLGAVGRIMYDSDVDAQSFCQLDKTPLELPAPCAVRPSSVAKDADALCAGVYMAEVFLPLLLQTVAGKLRGVMAHSESHVASVPIDIIDAMRHHLAVGECGVIVVIHLYGLSAIGSAAVTPERSEQFLFLRVNAEHRYAVLLTVFPVPPYNLELLVAFLAVCHSSVFTGLHRVYPSDLMICLTV